MSKIEAIVEIGGIMLIVGIIVIGVYYFTDVFQNIDRGGFSWTGSWKTEEAVCTKYSYDYSWLNFLACQTQACLNCEGSGGVGIDASVLDEFKSPKENCETRGYVWVGFHINRNRDYWIKKMEQEKEEKLNKTCIERERIWLETKIGGTA